MTLIQRDANIDNLLDRIDALQERVSIIESYPNDPDIPGLIVYNVKDYGAKGDDSTDDTAAIQAAIDQAAAGDHRTVFIPAGTYRISSSIVLDSHVSLLGETTYTTILKATTAITMIKIERGENLVQNLRLIGYDHTDSNSIAIQIGGNPSYTNVWDVLAGDLGLKASTVLILQKDRWNNEVLLIS